MHYLVLGTFGAGNAPPIAVARTQSETEFRPCTETGSPSRTKQMNQSIAPPS